jgi:hypothetical protein
MNRREFFTNAGAFAAFGPLLSVGDVLAADACVPNPPIIDKPVKPQVAASMKRLLAEAKTGRPRLTNMTRIDGYILEVDDLILWGRSEPNETELLFDDLMVAFQSIRFRYGPGTPGVSLESRYIPGESKSQTYVRVVENLSKIPKDDKFAYAKYCVAEVNGFPVVHGLPRDSLIAKTLLDADYIMKSMVLGNAKLKIKNPIVSAYDTYLGLGKKIMAGKASQSERDDLKAYAERGHRYYFVPGRMSYIKDEASVFIDCVQIVLEVRDIGNDGNMTLPPNPIMQKFGCSWTNRMEEIIPTETDWKKMRNIFRMFALARTIDQNQDTTHLADNQVISDYKIPTFSLPAQYPPIIRQEKIPYPSGRTGKNGERYWHPKTCGGVTVRYQNTSRSPDIVSDATKGDINLAGRKARESLRSCSGESCWKVE